MQIDNNERGLHNGLETQKRVFFLQTLQTLTIFNEKEKHTRRISSF